VRHQDKAVPCLYDKKQQSSLARLPVIPESRRDIRDPGAMPFKRLLHAGAGKNHLAAKILKKYFRNDITYRHIAKISFA
jgi:hypothetical protein